LLRFRAWIEGKDTKMHAQPATVDAADLRSRMTDQADFGTFGRFAETPVEQMPTDMKTAYDDTLKLRGMVPGPHKIWLANPALARTIVPTGAYFQTASTLTKAEIEIAVNVINGHWRSAYGNYEHERIGTLLAALPSERVAALIAGLPTSFEDMRQQIVYELASTLVAARVVPLAMFRRARELLGDAGIVDIAALMGWFTAVSLTLLAYDVPANAIGLNQ
jgi:4-carboxymuconolactone decarboxylase